MQNVVYFCLYSVQFASSPIPGRAIGLYSQLFQIFGLLSVVVFIVVSMLVLSFFIDKQYDKRGDGAIRVAMPRDAVIYSYKHMSGGNRLVFFANLRPKFRLENQNQRNG